MSSDKDDFVRQGLEDLHMLLRPPNLKSAVEFYGFGIARVLTRLAQLPGPEQARQIAEMHRQSMRLLEDLNKAVKELTQELTEKTDGK